MTVKQLRNTMSNDELVEWKAFYALKAQEQELELKKASS